MLEFALSFLSTVGQAETHYHCMGRLGFITIIFTANFGRLVTLHWMLSELYEHLSLLTSGDPRATIQQMIIKGVQVETWPWPKTHVHSLYLDWGCTVWPSNWQGPTVINFSQVNTWPQVWVFDILDLCTFKNI